MNRTKKTLIVIGLLILAGASVGAFFGLRKKPQSNQVVVPTNQAQVIRRPSHVRLEPISDFHKVYGFDFDFPDTWEIVSESVPDNVIDDPENLPEMIVNLKSSDYNVMAIMYVSPDNPGAHLSTLPRDGFTSQHGISAVLYNRSCSFAGTDDMYAVLEDPIRKYSTLITMHDICDDFGVPVSEVVFLEILDSILLVEAV